MSVRYVGFLAEDTGFGEAARRHLIALHDAGVQVHARSVCLDRDQNRTNRRPPFHHRQAWRLARRQGSFETALVHTPPMFFHLFMEPGVRNVGVTAFETNDLPARWTPALNAMDEIWVPSTFCARAFTKSTCRAVRVVPHPVEAIPPGPRDVPGIPSDVFLFLSVFEWSDRKNPDGLLRAFRRAFSSRIDVALLLKVGLRFQRDPSPIVKAISRIMGTDALKVFVLFDQLSPEWMQRLMRRADAYVSLHRAEGFGLTMAEAMAAETPVVATAYSGNMDFMDGRSAFLVDYELVKIRERLTKTRIFERSRYWAEPDLDGAVEALRVCAGSPGRRREVALRGNELVRQQLDPKRIGAAMKSLLR